MFSWFGKRHAQKPAATTVADGGDLSATATATASATATAAATATALSDALDEAETWPAPTAAAAIAPGAAADTPADPTHGLNVDAFLAPPPASANANAQPEVGPADAVQTDALKPPIIEAISTVFDPEIPVNIYELGLIYEVIVDAESRVAVRMTLTSPACPSAQQLPSEVRYKVKAVPGVTDCAVDVIWEPPWTKEMMSEAAKLSLGLF